LFLAIVGFVTDPDFVLWSIDEKLNRMREGRSLLNQSIAKKAKAALLSEDGSFVTERAILEMEGEPDGDAIATGPLCQVA
jgi:hypothetical protein